MKSAKHMTQWNKPSIFDIQSPQAFDKIAMEVFRFQAINNPVYHKFIELIGICIDDVKEISAIPFLPIQFFKDYQILIGNDYEGIFKSSGTTGMQRSQHYVKDLKIYRDSFIKGFEHFFGQITDYSILALLPSYVSQGDSSLVYMVQHLIELSQNKYSGFYLNDDEKLAKTLQEIDKTGQKILLIGVSYALLDLAEKYNFRLKNTIVMETGGMKGRRKEMLREELHQILQKSFGVKNIHSEYGMTELLSQSYSKGDGIFLSPPWQKILIRDTEDPFTYLENGKTGGVNVIDLANIYSCSFIATQDLGKKHENTFEILGRFDHSDVRGCNLLVI